MADYGLGIRLWSLGTFYRAIYDIFTNQPSSVDGGGPGTLSGLLIVDEIMKRLQVDLKQDKVPLPCEHADLMVGTGLGGYVF